MRLIILHLLLTGCFAVHLSDTTPPSPSSSRNLNYFAILTEKPPEKPSYYRATSERLSGLGSLGHQYLLFIPVTRLYLERGLSEYFNEFVVSAFGNGIVSNLSAPELFEIIGSDLTTFKLNKAKLSLTTRDYFFLRELIVEGEILLSYNGEQERPIALNKRSLSRSGTTAELSQLLHEALWEALEPTMPQKVRRRKPALTRYPLVICSVEPSFQRGMEYALREKSIPFISFRNSCPNDYIHSSYRLEIPNLQSDSRKERLTVEGAAVLRENNGVPLASYPIKDTIDSLTISSAPVSRALEELGAKFIRERF